MVRTATAALLVLLGAAGAPGAASARCTAWERLRMLESGLALPRIEELCDAPPERRRESANPGGFGQGPPPPAAPFPIPGPPPPPPLLVVPGPLLPFPVMTRACSSQAGLCPLLTPVPIGAACWCQGPSGPVPGQGR